MAGNYFRPLLFYISFSVSSIYSNSPLPQSLLSNSPKSPIISPLSNRHFALKYFAVLTFIKLVQLGGAV